MESIYLAIMVGTALIIAAAFSSLIAFRFGAPLLLLFLANARLDWGQYTQALRRRHPAAA